MRGLDTRVMLAKTRILFWVDAVEANKQMDVVRKMAEKDGFNDAANGFNVMPLMFADEPNLEHNWAIGQDRYNHFDAFAWREKCGKWAAEANKCCGLSFEVFSSRFNGTVDWALEQLPAFQRAEATAIAQSFGYETIEEREQARVWQEARALEAEEEGEDDYGHRDCCHGIAWGCCPAGCGSGPDD